MQGDGHVIFTFYEAALAECRDVEFCINKAVQHPENPVLVPGHPHQWDHMQISWPATVLYDPEDRKFRCWYSGLGRDFRWACGYAESGDGIHWTKPPLGKVMHLGRPTNMIPRISKESLLMPSFVMRNPLPNANEAERFISYWTEIVVNSSGHADMTFIRKALACSANGIDWTRKCTVYEVKPFDRASFQDISQILYEPDAPEESRIKGYSQILRTRDWDGRRNVRHIGLVVGSDVSLVKDYEDPVCLAPEKGIDEELHFASVKKISNTYVMLYESDRFEKNPLHGDLKLAVSNDGKKFWRVFKDEPLVSTGAKGTWNENLLVTTTSAIQEVGDEYYIFYLGCPNIYTEWPPEYAVEPERRGSLYAPVYLGLAILPRDRFGYVTAARKSGEILTRNVKITEDGVWLNADTPGPEDEIKVVIKDMTGGTVAQGRLGLERCQSVYRQVDFDRRIRRGDYQLSMTLHGEAKLFSVRV